MSEQGEERRSRRFGRGSSRNNGDKKALPRKTDKTDGDRPSTQEGTNLFNKDCGFSIKRETKSFRIPPALVFPFFSFPALPEKTPLG